MSLESEPGSGRETEPGRSRQRWRLIDDPVAIRALAHPLRHDLISIIGRLGRATTADAARELGISHGLASHHLRQLAKYGFVEQVAGKDNRERPWRLVATSYSWTGATGSLEDGCGRCGRAGLCRAGAGALSRLAAAAGRL